MYIHTHLFNTYVDTPPICNRFGSLPRLLAFAATESQNCIFILKIFL